MKNAIKDKLLTKQTTKDDEKWEMIEDNNWNPEIGDTIEGRLVSIRNGRIGEYETYIYIIESDNGKHTRVWGCTYLNQLMEEIIIGDYIRITYNGSRQTNNGHKMKLFNLERRINNEQKGNILESERG